jgi:hypothetical protein
MSLGVVGAGLGRTGTHSLKRALEQLLGAPCYHMAELVQHQDHVDLWYRATVGDLPDWDALFDGYAAAVDWPMVAFWREISDAYPDALILLSVRDVDAWWKSANDTIFGIMPRLAADEATQPFHRMLTQLFGRFTDDITNEGAVKAAFLRHNDDVRRTAPPGRLLEWQPAQGWAPICDALGVRVPDEPFPHVNTTDDFRARWQGRDPK